MFKARYQRLAVCLTIAVAVGFGALLGPGVRHRHEGGDVAHSHMHVDGPIHTHTHPHHHAHSHGHDHGNGHLHGHAHSHGSDQQIDAPATHVHVSIFGIELTLPDIWGGDGGPLTTPQGGGGFGAGQEFGGGTPSLPPMQLVQFMLRYEGIVPLKASLPGGNGAVGRYAALTDAGCGIDRPSPPDPPPRAA